MKLKTAKITFTALALGATFTGIARAQDTPRLILNGQPLSTQVAPIIQDGRALVPLRDIFEALGARVQYNANTRTITARRQGTIVRMELGRRRAEVNGQRVRLEVPATVVDGSTMVPLRFVSEALGATVRYNANRGVIRINNRADGLNGGRRNEGRRNDDLLNDDPLSNDPLTDDPLNNDRRDNYPEDGNDLGDQ